jgi:hypothetical protein
LRVGNSKHMDSEMISRRARDLALAEADEFLDRLELTEQEMCFVVTQTLLLFEVALQAYERWAEMEQVTLRPMAMSSALAVAAHISDRMDHHIQRLVSEQRENEK